MSTTPPIAAVTGRRAPAAAGTGMPADGHEAYRRGLCVDCKTRWHSPGRTRCDTCHETYAGATVLKRTPSSGRRGRTHAA